MQTPNLSALSQDASAQVKVVDAKMINFDGQELFSKLEYGEDDSGQKGGM